MAKFHGAYTSTPVVERVETCPAHDVYLNHSQNLGSYRLNVAILPENPFSLFDDNAGKPLSEIGPVYGVKTYEVREHVTRIWRCERVEIADREMPKLREFGFYENYHAFVLCVPDSEQTMQEEQKEQQKPMTKREFQQRYHAYKASSRDEAQKEADRVNDQGIVNDTAVVVEFPGMGFCLMMKSAAEFAMGINIIPKQDI